MSSEEFWFLSKIHLQNSIISFLFPFVLRRERKKESWCENLDKRMCGLNYIQDDFSLFKTIVSFALCMNARWFSCELGNFASSPILSCV